MGFLTPTEIDSLRIARICLHIVGGEDEFEPQPELPVEHDDFLLQILKEIASDSVYRFADISTTRGTVEGVARREQSFEESAQSLAADFCRFHKGRTRDGAFFVFELGVEDPDVNIYGLIKYDYSQALELVHREGANGLRRIVEAFASDKSSIQKAALIRTVNGIATPAISTRDRMGRPAPNLTDFFQSYLQVVRDRSDQELTTEVREVVRTALTDHREHFQKGEMAVGIARAIDVLRNASEITEDVMRQAVWVGAGQPDDEAFKSNLEVSVNRLIRKKKLAGLSFTPHQESLPKTVRRRVQTQEGITIEYNTSLEGQAIRKEDLEDGTTRFIVTTRNYSDGVISDRAGRPTR
jgi:hypothetical protein